LPPEVCFNFYIRLTIGKPLKFTASEILSEVGFAMIRE